ncbi:MAG: hypothetical protein FIB06_00805 [Betaproteobacteria bacterium]|nr:hypothetical protein [Betaproteobacteria bacterium]
MRTLALVAALLVAACSSSGAGKPASGSSTGSSRLYQLTDAEKVGNALRLTFATEWRSLQCSAAIDGLKVGSGQGNSLAGVAKVSIYVPSKYEARPVGDFVIQCSQF